MRSKKAIYNVVSSLALQFVIILYGFIVPKIIITNFGSDVNGLVSSITQFLAYITLLESGFGPVVKSVLYKPIAEKNKLEIENILKTAENFFRKIAFIFILYIILLCIVYPILINQQFNSTFTITLIIIISISTFAEYFFGMTYKLYLQAEQRTYVISVIQMLTYFLSIFLILICVKFNASIQFIKLVSGLVFVARPILQNYYVKKIFKINLHNADAGYKINNKWDGLAQHVASVIHNNTDITVLTIFCSLSTVSVYTVYQLVISGIKKLIQSFSNGIDSSFGDMIAKNEQENLQKKFGMYESIYFSIITIIFTCTIILIVPFVKVYTRGINDANYIRPLFGILIVISEYIWAIRLPYSTITYAAGHFKETRIGAWIECFINLFLSVILVFKFELVGVAIGTIIAMFIRTVEFVFHTNKYILKRSQIASIKKMLFIIIETLLAIFIFSFIPSISCESYFDWICVGLIAAFISIIITMLVNSVVYKKDFTNIYIILKRFLKHSN